MVNRCGSTTYNSVDGLLAGAFLGIFRGCDCDAVSGLAVCESPPVSPHEFPAHGHARRQQ